jgi:Transcriptional regulators
MASAASNKIELDEIDLAIISHLSEDSRMSFAKMSKATGYPDATIQHRFKRLMREGVIKRFTIELNSIYVEHGVVSMALLKTVSEKHDDVQKELEALPEVTDIYVVLANMIS